MSCFPQLTSRNIEIVAQETRELLDDEARDLYADLADEVTMFVILFKTHLVYKDVFLCSDLISLT